MGKAVKPLLLVAAAATAFIPGVGLAVGMAAFNAGLSVAAASAIMTALPGVLLAGAGMIKTGGRGSTSLTPFDIKTINSDPAAKRKLVFGRTAFPLDLRYAEPSGTNQEFIDYVFALAAHKSDGIEEIYIEDKLAWTSAGGAQGIFVGYLTVEVILEASAGAFHTVNAGTTWGASQRMAGCTTMKVRVKRSDNSSSSKSPFANGIAGRWTVIGRGMPVYDPAQDSTVAGGSGSQRANNCATWAYTSGTGRGANPALKLCAYLLGWRINGVVSVGCGMDAGLLDLASFAVAAAKCDESVALVGGGAQRRYEGGAVFSDEEDPGTVIAAMLSAMNGELFDDGGRLALRVAVNDLTAAHTFTDDDIQGGFSWVPVPPVSEQYTVVRGQFVQPNAPSLFGLADYPEVAIPRATAAPRPMALGFRMVQDVRRAERIAKQAGQRNLYMGTFSCQFGVRGWLLRRNMIIAMTSNARNWSAKLFRVRSLRFNPDATVDVVLREENAAVYQWDNDETGNVSPVTPTTYDPRNSPWITAVATAATTANWSGVVDDGRRPENNASASDNMIKNGSVAISADGWTFIGAAFWQAFAVSGAPSTGILTFPVSASPAIAIANNGARIPITSSDRIFVSGTAFYDGGSVGTFVVNIDWYRADGAPSALSAGWQTSIVPSGGGGAWTPFAAQVTPPADAATMVVGMVSGPRILAQAYATNLRVARTQTAADVTALNTAADTAMVNGVAAATVLGNISTAQATADAALAAGVLAVTPKVITGLGASAAVDVTIPAGETRGFQSVVYYDLTSGTTTASCPLEFRTVAGGGWTAFGTSSPETDTGPSVLFPSAVGSLTNAGSETANYQVRAVVSVTGSPTGAVDANRSFVGPA